MTRAVDARHRVRAAAELVGADPRTQAVDTIEPAVGPRGSWVLEVVLAGDGVPPGIQQALAEHRLTIVDVSPQGPDHCVATAVVA